ncbi:phage tail family protein [Brevibacillus agri]
MRKLTFTNARGESVTLGNSAPFLVTKLEGTGAVDADIKTQKSPYQDGETYLDAFLEPRQLYLEGAVLAKSRVELFALRRELSRILNPKLGRGKLVYKYDGGEKEIKVIVDGSPVFPDRTGQPTQKFLIDLFCPEPFWLDTFTISREMSYVMGGFHFLLKLPTSFSSRTYRRVLTNEGDVETPVRIEFKGPAQNPTVTNLTTNEFIKVKRDLGENDVLHIDTAFGNKRVEIVHEDGSTENAFNFIDLESTFFQLQVGENELEYNSNNDSTKTRVTIKYRNRYVGV